VNGLIYGQIAKYVLDKTIPDHRAIVLKESLVDFRSLDKWQTNIGIKEIIKGFWDNYEINVSDVLILT